MKTKSMAPSLRERLRRWRIGGSLAVAALFLAACGGGGGSSADAPVANPPVVAESAQVRTVNALDDAAVAKLSAGSEATNSADVDSPVSEFAKVADNAPMSLSVVAETSSSAAGASAQSGSSSAVSVPMTAGKGDKVTVFAMGDSGAVRSMHTNITALT